MASDAVQIFTIERPCQSHFDPKTLALNEIDRTTNQFFRRLVYLHDSEIVVPVSAAEKRQYSLAILMRYKQSWRPTGYGLGDLCFSVSLLPNEELTLEVKTWETDKRSWDSESEVTSRNLTDVSAERSDTSEVLHDVNKKERFQIDASAEASWGFGSASVKTSYATELAEQSKTFDSTSKKSAQRSVSELNQKRAVKIGVSRESGSEEKTTRKIRNINQTRTLNANYYQILQQYEVSLILEEVNLVLLGQKWNPIPTSVELPDYPRTAIIVDSLKNYSLDPKSPESFQNTLLRYVTPLPDISTEPTPLDQLRFAFLLNKDREKDVLEYLFSLMAAHLKGERRAETVPLIPNDHFLQSAAERDLNTTIREVIDEILKNLQEARAHVAQPVGAPWASAIATHGVYTETVLGECSAGEDFIEVSRQFDLEIKKAEIEKLKLEVERLKILNGQLSAGNERKINVKADKPEIKVNVNIDAEKEGPNITVA